MLPLDLAKTAILLHLSRTAGPQADDALIPAVNAYANNNPYAAMEPARQGLLRSGHLTAAVIHERQGFFSSQKTGYVLTAKGEELAAALQGRNPQEICAAAAFELLRQAQQQGHVRRAAHVADVGPATTRAVFDRLVEEGALSPVTLGSGLNGQPGGCLTALGKSRLAQKAAPGA